MRDLLTSRFLLAATIVAVGLIPLISAAPPAPPDPPPPPVDLFEVEIKPQPLPPIPDDPPPHEGAMIDYPIVVDPPDLILVEVLEALPGRPISGERMVRADGTISLGFYGDVHVRGLTARQIKIKIIKHLRRTLPDEVLGLIEALEPVTGTPQEGEDGAPEEKTKQEKVKPAVPPPPPEPGAEPLLGPLPPFNPCKPEEEPKHGPSTPFDPSLPLDPLPEGVDAVYVSPGDSNRVFVDVTAYNSKNYFVQGDVASPGRLPWTGNETVLDAMSYAGGLIHEADPKNIRLVRPPRGGKPARIYKIDLEAIKERGEIEKNYQIFPGDRIIVGRDAVVKTTLEIDRFLYPMQSVFYAILRQSYAIRSMMLEANGGAAAAITPEQREAMVKEWTDFWWKVASRPADAELDEKTFREALMRAINPPGAVKQPEEKK